MAVCVCVCHDIQHLFVFRKHFPATTASVSGFGSFPISFVKSSLLLKFEKGKGKRHKGHAYSLFSPAKETNLG